MRRKLFGVLGAFVCMPAMANAATLYMDPYETTINRGDSVSVSVRLDTDEGECVNTIDGVIHYSENIQAIDTSRGNSIMSIWIEEPVIDTKNRTITFAGGIPNGYCGRITGDPRLTNHILEIVFSSPSMMIGASQVSNLAEVTWDEQTQVLLNDGFGTQAPLQKFGSTLNLTNTVGSQVNEWAERVANDEQPPEDFSITLESTPNAFGGAYFISFNTTDKQSGIDYYEVIEEPLEDSELFSWGGVDAPWKEVASPYLLTDQSLNSTIRVRAVDKAGNVYVATVVPDTAERGITTKTKQLIAIVIGGLVLFGAIGFAIWYWRRRKTEYEYYEEEYEEEYEDESDE